MPDTKITPRQIRLKMDWTQEKMANKLGISREHYGRIELNSSLLRSASIDIAIRLSKIAKIKLDDINFFY